jgi:hypothetical protein
MTSPETDLRDTAFALDEMEFLDALESYVRDRIAEYEMVRGDILTLILGAMLSRADGRIEVTRRELEETARVHMWTEELGDKVVMVAELAGGSGCGVLGCHGFGSHTGVTR